MKRHTRIWLAVARGLHFCLSAIFGVSLLITAPLAAHAQAVSATVPVGQQPDAVAVNPVTNKIYVANLSSNNVTVIDGATNSTVTVADPNATRPVAVAVNSVTNKIYVANDSSNNVTVIDGVTNSTATITDPNAMEPIALAVNSVTNEIYVANFRSDNVTVINGATNATTTVKDPSSPFLLPDAVAVNPVTNKIYIGNRSTANVTVIDGATNSTTTVTDPQAAPVLAPISIAVNTVTNKIYTSNNGDGITDRGNVTVIDGATNATVNIPAPLDTFMPEKIAVNPVTNKIYVVYLNVTFAGSGVVVIDGATNSSTTILDPNSAGSGDLAVNSVTNKIFVPTGSTISEPTGHVTVMDGATNAIGAIRDPNAINPSVVAVNSITNKIYVANAGSNNVTVIDGAVAFGGADLTIRKIGTSHTAVPGGTINYAIALNNLGPNNARSVRVTDFLPFQTKFVSCKADAGGTCTNTAGLVTITFPAIAKAHSAFITVIAQVEAVSGTMFSNTAIITSATSDPDSNNNFSTASTVVRYTTDLSIQKSIVMGGAAGELKYLINVTALNTTAHGVIVTDPLPSGTTFVSATASQGSCTMPAVGANGAVTCNLATMRGGTSATVFIIVKVNAPSGTTLSNTATVNALTFDTNQANNSSTITTKVP